MKAENGNTMVTPVLKPVYQNSRKSDGKQEKATKIGGSMRAKVNSLPK